MKCKFDAKNHWCRPGTCLVQVLLFLSGNYEQYWVGSLFWVLTWILYLCEGESDVQISAATHFHAQRIAIINEQDCMGIKELSTKKYWTEFVRVFCMKANVKRVMYALITFFWLSIVFPMFIVKRDDFMNIWYHSFILDTRWLCWYYSRLFFICGFFFFLFELIETESSVASL